MKCPDDVVTPQAARGFRVGACRNRASDQPVFYDKIHKSKKTPKSGTVVLDLQLMLLKSKR
jgi:hypothetical protein